MTAHAQTLATEHVLAEVRNQVGHLTLNRPAGLNALTLDMVRSLRQHLDQWAEDPHVRAVVLRGEGPKGFCAGGDIRSLHDSFKAGDTLHETFFVEEYALDLLIHRYRKPVLVLMDGFTLGGGMGLAQGCDLRVVTERSRLGMPEVGIGYFPDVGGSYFLSRIPASWGLPGVSGTQIQAADALYCGLADWYLASDQLAALDQGLEQLSFGDNPLKDLQNLLARLGTQVLSDAPLEKLRPVIDHFFSLPTCKPSSSNCVRSASATAMPGPWPPPTSWKAAHRWPWRLLWRCCAAVAARAGRLLCHGAAPGPPVVPAWRHHRRRARPDHRQGQTASLEPADPGRAAAAAGGPIFEGL